jgi:hypothetical protein
MSFFQTVVNWLTNFFAWMEQAFLWVLDGLAVILQFVVFTILDGLFLVVESIIAAIDLSAVVFNYAAAWSHLPDQLIWLINALGLPQCFTILGSAYLIRLLLNLIPSVFTRV